MNVPEILRIRLHVNSVPVFYPNFVVDLNELSDYLRLAILV